MRKRPKKRKKTCIDLRRSDGIWQFYVGGILLGVFLVFAASGRLGQILV